MSVRKQPVSALQELSAQQHWQLPVYMSMHGTTPTEPFSTTVTVQGIEAKGHGTTKQMSKHNAAHAALVMLSEKYGSAVVMPKVLSDYFAGHDDGEGAAARPLPADGSLRCNVCCITCGDIVAFQAHLKGKQHAKNEKRKSSGLNDGAKNCSICEVTCSGPEAYQQHLLGRSHQRRVCLVRDDRKCLYCKKQFFDLINFQKHMLEHIKRLRNTVLDDPSSNIKICTSGFPSSPPPAPNIEPELQAPAVEEPQVAVDSVSSSIERLNLQAPVGVLPCKDVVQDQSFDVQEAAASVNIDGAGASAPEESAGPSSNAGANLADQQEPCSKEEGNALEKEPQDGAQGDEDVVEVDDEDTLNALIEICKCIKAARTERGN